MPGKFEIDESFIEKWERQYDEIESDEGEYQEIVAAVLKEVSENFTISKSTLVRILDWKAHRVKGNVGLEDFDVYAQKLRQCIQSSEDQ